MTLPFKANRQEAARRATLARYTLTTFLTAVAVFVTATQPSAQERRTIMDMLFGRREPAPMPEWYAPPPPPPPARRNQRPRTASKPAATTEPVITEIKVEKRADARKVLVVGDFLASGLGDGLTEAFTAAPGIVIVSRPNGSSGLVREDYYNWQMELPGMIAEVKPAVVIIMLGANDRQQIDLRDGAHRFGSPEWFSEYDRRAAALAATARGRNTPLIWVGLPPFQATSLTADAVTLNRTLRSEAEKAGGDFIDIWDGFADEAGKFVTTGSDINGKPARLRGTDGISFSKAGKRKLAFYLEKPIKDLLGEAAETIMPGALRLGPENPPDLVPLAPSSPNMPAASMPVAITDPELDGGQVLLGATPTPVRITPSPRDRLIERGELPPAPSGRADSGWSRRNAP